MFRYKTRFSNVVTASLNVDKEVLFANASIDSLKGLIPASVNLEKNIDLVGAGFNAAVVNSFNKNGDGIDTNAALAIKNYFVHKPANIEHKKNRVVGHIVNAGFSRYNTNELLSDEEARSITDPFNISLAAVVYKTVDRNFADSLIASNDPSSPLYQKISASWEIGFNDYILALGSSNLKDAEIVSNPAQIKELQKYLKMFDGSGSLADGTPIYRLIVGRIYPLGIGFTTNPAANVQGVAVDDGNCEMIEKENEEKDEEEEEEEKEENEEEEEDEKEESESVEIDSSLVLQLFKKKISQTEKQPVNINKSKIMDLEQIIAAMKVVLAERQESVQFSEESVASISAKIAESIKSKNEEFQTRLSEAEAAKVKAAADAEKLRIDLDSTLSKLSELEAMVKAQASQELYNSRMSVLDQDYDFDDSDRSILAKDISALDSSDESFAAYKEKVAVMFKHKNKMAKAEQEKEMCEKIEKEVAKRLSTASVKTEEVKEVDVAAALASAKKEETVLETVTPTESWKTKVSKAFSKENVTIKY